MYKKVLVSIVIILICIYILSERKDEKLSVSKELSVDQYVNVRDELLEIMNTHDPAFVLTTLQERIKTDNALLRKCHSLVHELGHAAFEKYNDFGAAVKYQDEMCNSGYIHGIIESYFSTSRDLMENMQTVCNQYPTGKYLSWECYHGVGHGLMYYTSNDLPTSLTYCDLYENDFARKSCVNGVFMENFNTDQKLHTSKYLDPDDPFFPCIKQRPDHKADCYMYAPTYYLSLHKNEYADAIKWCKHAEKTYQRSCIHGVGSQTMKENINNPKLAEQICTQRVLPFTSSCVEGMVGLYINHFGSLEPADTLCKTLNPKNRQVCDSVVQSYAKLFN